MPENPLLQYLQNMLGQQQGQGQQPFNPFADAPSNVMFGDSPFTQNHPRIAGGIEGALLGLANFEPQETIGGNLSAIARGLVGMGQSKQKMQMNALMAPFQAAQPLMQMQEFAMRQKMNQAQLDSLVELTPAQAARVGLKPGAKVHFKDVMGFLGDKKIDDPEERKAWVRANPNLFPSETEANDYILYGTRVPAPPKEAKDNEADLIRQSLGVDPKFALMTPEQQAQAILNERDRRQRSKNPSFVFPRPDSDEKLLTPDEAIRFGVPYGTSRSAVFGKTAKSSKPPTEGERRALTFYIRGRDAEQSIMVPRTEGGESIEDKIANLGLTGQTWLNNAPNWLQTEEAQLYRQAKRAFTEARLRKDSGAAIPPFEYDNDDKTYFAQPGDGPVVLAQKRASRAAALKAIQLEAGRAYMEAFGESPVVGPDVLSAPNVLDNSFLNGPPTPTPPNSEADAFLEKYDLKGKKKK